MPLKHPGEGSPKTGLAIALAVKRKSNSKKKMMAKGGEVPKEDMGRNLDKSVLSQQANSNASLNPGKEAKMPSLESIAERLPKKAQEHEVIAEPSQPVMKVEPKKENLPQNMNPKADHVAIMNPKDMADAVMKRKKAKMMAQGGQISEDLEYLDEDESYPDPDLMEFDSLDPHQPDFMAEGGEIEGEEPSMMDKVKKALSPSDSDIAKGIAKAGKGSNEDLSQYGERKANGGEIDEDSPEEKKKKRLHNIMMAMSED